MLALILAGCVGPTREQAVCADRVSGYLYVRTYEALVVGPDPDASCVRTELINEGYAGYDRVPVDPTLTLASFRDIETEPSTLAGLVDGYPEVGIGSSFSRTVFEFGTRSGDVFPLPEGTTPEGQSIPVQPEDGLVSSVVTLRGVEVFGRAAGLVAEVPDGFGGIELVVRCSDCEVVVPYAPTDLHLELERATLHICFDTDADVEGSLTDTVVHAQRPSEEDRRVIEVTGRRDISGVFQGLGALLQDGAHRIEGGELCRDVEYTWTP